MCYMCYFNKSTVSTLGGQNIELVISDLRGIPERPCVRGNSFWKI